MVIFNNHLLKPLNIHQKHLIRGERDPLEPHGGISVRFGEETDVWLMYKINGLKCIRNRKVYVTCGRTLN